MSAVLPVPPERAWEALVRWEEQPRWMRDAARVRVLTRSREGVGVLIAATTRVLGLPLLTERLEVVVWDPPRQLVIAHRSLVRGVGTWTLEPHPGGSRFGWTERLSLPPPVLGELALLAYRPVLRWLMRGSAANLARYLAST